MVTPPIEYYNHIKVINATASHEETNLLHISAGKQEKYPRTEVNIPRGI
jgi:hypothetical protein